MKKLLVVLIVFIFAQPVYSKVVHIPLEKAVEITLENNLDIYSKKQQIKELEQEVKIANALKNPQIQSNFLMGDVTKGNSSQVGIALPIEVGKRTARKKVAKMKLKIAKNELRATEHNLKIKVMRYYFNILYMKSIVSILEEREKLFSSMKLIIELKSKKIPTYTIDVLQNEMKYKKQLVFLNQAKARLLEAQFSLNDAMNVNNSEIMYDTSESSLFNKDLELLNIDILPYDTIEKSL